MTTTVAIRRLAVVIASALTVADCTFNPDDLRQLPDAYGGAQDAAGADLAAASEAGPPSGLDAEKDGKPDVPLPGSEVGPTVDGGLDQRAAAETGGDGPTDVDVPPLDVAMDLAGQDGPRDGRGVDLSVPGTGGSGVGGATSTGGVPGTGGITSTGGTTGKGGTTGTGGAPG